MDDLRLLGEYTTRQAHGEYPAGSKCIAFRDEDGNLVLKMHDGEIVKLDFWHYAEGLESPRDFLHKSPLTASIIAAEDERIIRALDDAAATLKDDK